MLKIRMATKQVGYTRVANFDRKYNFDIDSLQAAYLASLRFRAWRYEVYMRNRTDYGDPNEAYQLLLTLEAQKCGDLRLCLSEKVLGVRKEAKEIIIQMKTIADQEEREVTFTTPTTAS